MSEQPLSNLNFQARWVWFAFFLPLCSLTGLGMGFAFGISPYLTLLLISAVGSLPGWLPQVTARWSATYLAEMIMLGLLIIVGFGVSLQALIPLILLEGNVRVEAVTSLLLLTPPLYIVYTLLNANNSKHQEESSIDHLVTLFLGPPIILSLAMGTVIATYALLLIHYIQLHYLSWAWLAEKFLDRGIIPPLTLILFCWAVLILINKAWTLKREETLLIHNNESAILLKAQKKAMPGTKSRTQAYQNLMDNFFNTIWKKSADSYAILRYINWAMPILGFIGTVLGISLAASGIQKIISSQDGIAEFSSDLGQAIAPLGIAFDTTLIALSLSVLLMLLQTLLQRWEEEILVDHENKVRSKG